MENRNKKTTDALTIGSKCFLVNRSYAEQKKQGGRIVSARVTTFVNVKGEIQPEFAEVGNSKNLMTLNHYIPYVDVQSAINAITS